MAIDLSNLGNKRENEGITAEGKLTAKEFNNFVAAVQENQTEVASVKDDIQIIRESDKKNIKKVTYQGVDYIPDEKGTINIEDTESGYDLKAKFSSGKPVVTQGGSFVMSVTVTHREVTDGHFEPSKSPVTIEYYFGEYGKEKVVQSQKALHGDTKSFDFKDYMITGMNRPNAYVKVTNGINAVRSPNNELIILYIDFFLRHFQETKIQKNRDWELNFSTSTASGSSTGAVIPIVYAQIDNNEPIVKTARPGANEEDSIMIHEKPESGVRTLKIWAETTFTDPTTLESTTVSVEPETYEYIYVDEENIQKDKILIASNLSQIKSISRYDNLIIKYWIYQKSAQGNLEKDEPVYKTVSLVMSNGKGLTDDFKISTSQSVPFLGGVSAVQNWTAALLGGVELEGKKYLNISCGNTIKNFPITITEAEVELKEDPTYKVKLTAAGRSNSDGDKNIWEDHGYKIQGMDALEYTSSGSGWRTNKDGSTYLHLRRNRFITLDYKLFAKNPSWTEDGTHEGLTFSVEFSTSNCVSKEAIAISCLDNSTEKGTGIEIRANSMFVSDGHDRVPVEYKENARVRIDIVIEGDQKTYTYKAGDQEEKEHKEALLWIYVDGVYQRMFEITKGVNFKQPNPQIITFGSNDCEVDIYTIRIYNKALSMQKILNNYAFDAPVPSDKITLQKRNSVLAEDQYGNIFITEDSLKESRPDLPIMHWALVGNKLPVDKKEWLLMSKMDYKNPLNIGRPFEGNATFEIEKSVIKNQGSSSMRYPVPYRNYDWKPDKKAIGNAGKFNFGVEAGADDVRYQSKYKIYEGMPGIKKITLKKDYASSEMVNNIICSELYSDMAKGIGGFDGYSDALSPTQELVAGKDTVEDYRLSLIGKPLFVFYDLGDQKNIPLGMFNLIPNKNEVDYLGFTEEYHLKSDPLKGIKINTIHEGFKSEKQGIGEDAKEVPVRDEHGDYIYNGNIAQSWEIRDNFEFMEDVFEEPYYVYTAVEVENEEWNEKLEPAWNEKKAAYDKKYESALEKPEIYPYPDYPEYSEEGKIAWDTFKKSYDEKYAEVKEEERPELYPYPSYPPPETIIDTRWKAKSVWDSYEARYPKDSLLSFKADGDDQDYGYQEEKVFKDSEFRHIDPLETPIEGADWTPGDGSWTEFAKQKIDELHKTKAECAQLRDFHNWVASTNRQKPTNLTFAEILKRAQDPHNDPRFPKPEEDHSGFYRSLNLIINGEVNGEPAYIEPGGSKFTKDTAEYRFAKFKTEAINHWDPEKKMWRPGGWLRLNQWLLYYLWMEQFWMMDSGSKNLQIYTMGKSVDSKYAPYEWGAMVRDADTGLGINNEGRFTFPPYLEDTDYYDLTEPDIYKKFTYNTEDVPKPSNLSYVLNGQKGIMWKNLRDIFGGKSSETKMGKMYAQLFQNATMTKFSYPETIKRFEDHQAAWSEALYDFGSKQYHEDPSRLHWIESGLGDKKHQRRNWLYYGFRYRASKYDTNKISRFTFKIFNDAADAKAETLNVQTYTPIYIRFCDTDGKPNFIDYQRHVDLTKTATITVRTGMHDTNMFLDDGDLYTDLGDMYKIGGKVNGVSSFATEGAAGSRLRSLKFGYHKDLEAYVNTKLPTLDLKNFRELELLDLSSCIALTGTLEISTLDQLKEVYLEDTRYSALSLPETPSLETIWLNGGQSAIKLINLPNLTEFTVGRHVYNAKYDKYDFKEIYDYRTGKYEGEGTDKHEIIIPDVSVYHKLESIIVKNCPKLNIYPVVSKALEKGILKEINIDNVNWEEADLNVIEKLLELKEAGNSIYIAGHIKTTGAPSFELKERLKKTWGDIDNPENLLYIEYTKVPILHIKIDKQKFFKNPGDYQLSFSVSGNDYDSWDWTIDDNLFGATITPEGLLHIDRLGNEYEDNKPITYAHINIRKAYSDEPIISGKIELHLYYRVAKPGYYVFADGSYGPTLETGLGQEPIGVCFYVDPKNDENRLMMALRSLSNFDTAGWGANSYSFPGFTLGGEAFNINNIPNYRNINADGLLPGKEVTTDEKYRGPIPEDPDDPHNTVDSQGFIIFSEDVDQGAHPGPFFAQIGFKKLSADIISERKNEDGTPVFTWDRKKEIANGQEKTLRVLNHRDHIIRYADPSLELHYPKKEEGETELQALRRTITENDIAHSENKYSLFYYPAVSACVAYAPIVPGLDERFKEGNWFLPSVGEMARMQYYFKKVGKDSPEHTDPNNVLQTAINDGRLEARPSFMWSCDTPRDKDNAIMFAPGDISLSGTSSTSLKKSYKGNTGIWPICTF